MSEILDILNDNLEDVDLSMPLIPKSDQVLDVKSCEKVENKSKPGNYLIRIGLATTQPSTSVKGETIPVGTYVFDQISLTPTELYSEDQIRKRLKQFRMACIGAQGGGFGDPAQYVGSTLTARVKIQDAQGDWPAKNAIAYYKTA